MLKYLLFLRKKHCYTHIKHHADDVVSDGDEGTGGDGRVYLQFLQSHRNQCAEDGGKHHDSKKT